MAERRYVHNIPTARILRTRMTPSETLLWERLRDRRFLGLKFRRQHAVGRFVLDFYCEEVQLAVEVDGGVHDRPAQRAADAERQGAIELRGVRFVRVSASMVENDVEMALETIATAANALNPGPSPDPAGEGSQAELVCGPQPPELTERSSLPLSRLRGRGGRGVRA